jgi:single-strand DNA-binding protein
VNVVVLQGVVARAPEARELASGSQLVMLEVSTDTEDGRTTVPVAWADPAGRWPDVGEEVVVTGCVRRRFFRAGGATQSRTEVVAAGVVSVRAKAKVRRALDEALASVADARA